MGANSVTIAAMNTHYKQKTATHWQRLSGTHREKGYSVAVSLWRQLPKTLETVVWRMVAFCRHHWITLAGFVLTVAGWFVAR